MSLVFIMTASPWSRNEKPDGAVTSHVSLAWQGQFCNAQLKALEDWPGRIKGTEQGKGQLKANRRLIKMKRNKWCLND